MCQAHRLALWCSLTMFGATNFSPTATLPTATFQTHFFPKLHLFHIQTLFSFLTTNKWFSNKQLVLRRVSWKWHWHNFTMVSSGNLSRQWDIWEWCSRGKRRGTHYSNVHYCFRLHGQMQRIISSGGSGIDRVLGVLYEDIHWILLIAGNILTLVTRIEPMTSQLETKNASHLHLVAEGDIPMTLGYLCQQCFP